MSYIERVGNIDYSPYRPALNPAFVRRVREKRRLQALAEAETRRAEAAREQRAVNAKKRAKAAAERRAARQGFCKLMRANGAPTWVLDLVLDVAEKHSVSPTDIAGKSARSTKPVAKARNEALYMIKERNGDLSFPRIAKWFDRDHTGVMHSIAKHAAINGLPPLCGYTIARRGLKSLSRKHLDRET